MKKLIFASLLAFAACFDAAAQEYKVVTIVESIIPMGTGRSRIIETTSEADSDAATTERVDGKKSDQGKVKRGDLKVENFKETKLVKLFQRCRNQLPEHRFQRCFDHGQDQQLGGCRLEPRVCRQWRRIRLWKGRWAGPLHYPPDFQEISDFRKSEITRCHILGWSLSLLQLSLGMAIGK